MASSLWGLRQTEDEQETMRKATMEMAANATVDAGNQPVDEGVTDFDDDEEVELVNEEEDIPEITDDIPEPEKMGIGEHARMTVRSETGKRADQILNGGDDLYTRAMDMFGVSREGSASALVHSAPFARQLSKMSANIEERNLGRLLDGDYGDEELDEIVNASGNVLRNSDNEIKRLAAGAENPSAERRKMLQMAAYDELLNRAKTRKDAESNLKSRKQTTWGKIVSGTLENSGYVNSFIYGSSIAGGLGLGIAATPGASALSKIGVNAVNTMIGSAPASIAGGAERATRLMKDDYTVGADGELQVIDNNYGEMRSLIQGGAGGFVENAVVEGGTDIAIDLACLGLSKIPAARAFVVEPLKRMGAAAVKKMMGTSAGRGLLHLGKGYNTFAQFTNVHSLPVEMLEEDIQPIFDNVFGLDKKRGEWGRDTETKEEGEGFFGKLGNEIGNYNRDQLNLQTQADIFWGLVGTCLVQAGAGSISTAGGGGRSVPGATTAKEATSVLVDYAGVPNEMVSTLNDEDKIKMAYAYRVMSGNPDKLVEFAQRIGTKAETIVEGIVNREGARMNVQLKEAGLSPSSFVIPLKEDGKTPDFEEETGIDGLTGNEIARKVVSDRESGVRIYDNGVGAGSERAYTVENPITGTSVDVPNLVLARKTASLFKNELLLTAKNRENKAKYIYNVWKQKYGNTPVHLAQTVEEAVEFSKRKGVDVENEEGFSPDRAAWRLKDGTIVMVSDNISSPYEVDALFQHEIVGHNNDAMRDEFMANLDSKAVKEAQKALGLTDEQMSDPRVQREVFANVIQQRRHNPSAMQKLKHWYNEQLRKRGVDRKISDADIEAFAQRWEKEAMGDSGEFQMPISSRKSSAAEEAPAETRENATVNASGEDGTVGRQDEETSPEGGESKDDDIVDIEDDIPDTEAIETAVPKEESKKPITEQNIIEKMTNEAPTEEVSIEDGDPDAVVYDETLKPNFKGGANPETGEVNPLMGKPFDLVSNPILVYEFAKPRIGKNGKPVKRVVGTGVHRYQLYRRAGRKTIPARILREADGYTLEDVMKIDAVGNIIDGQGSVRDYVKFFDDMKTSRKEAEDGGYLSRMKGKTAFSIHEGATDDTKAAVDWDGAGNDGMISTEQAGIIAESAPKDVHPRNKALQRILVAKALNGLRGKKLAIVARSLAEEVKKEKAGSGAGGAMQLDLFSSAEDLELLAMEEKRAEYRVGKANEYKRIAENLRTAMSKGGKLDLNGEYARELGINDPKDKKQLSAARDKAVELANYWENAIRLNADDKTAMDEAIKESSAKASGKKAEITGKLDAIKQGKTASKGEKSAKTDKQNPEVVVAKNETATTATTDKKSEVAKTPKNAPVSVPKETATTSRQTSADAVDGGKSSADAESERIGKLSDEELVKEHYEAKKSGKNFNRLGSELLRRGIYVSKRTQIVPYRDEDGNPRVGSTAPIVIYHGKTGKDIAKFDEGEETTLTSKESLAVQKPAATPVAPTVRMKDEESEKKAEAQEDALAALFATPELDPYKAYALSGDEIRKEMPGYDRLDYKTHVDRTGFVGPRIEEKFQRLLKERKDKGNGTVVFLAGGNGAGKSTLAQRIGGTPDFVIDSTLGNIDVARKQIDAILANGQKPVIAFVYRSPWDSLNGIVNRMRDGGHIVSPLSFANSHTKSRENLRLLYDEYGDIIDIRIYDNSAPGAPRITIDELEKKGKPDHAKLRKNADFYLEAERGRLARQGGAGGVRGSGEAGRQEVSFATGELDPKNESLTETANALEDSRSEATAKETNTNPKKTRKAMKLFRKYADGSYGALFIDSAKRLVPGEWYEAKSPSIENLKNLEGMERSDAFKWGKVYLLDAQGKATPIQKMPTVRELNAVTAAGGRYMAVTFGSNGKKLYYNLGINGSGSVAGFAYRPGWHSTNAPSAAHIGKSHGMKGKVSATGQNHYRAYDEVWCEIEIPDDIDYNKAALDRAPFLKERGRTTEKNRKEAQLDYIPLGGSYFFRTNSNADEKQEWIISGAIKIVREMSREEVNRYNRENGFLPDAPIAGNREEAEAKQNAEPNDVYWASPEFDPKVFQARVGAVAELAKTYVDSGVGEFKTLAMRMAARFPDKFGNMKPYLRGVWNVVAEQMGLEEVTKKEAEDIYTEAEKVYNVNQGESTNGLRQSGNVDESGAPASSGVPAERGNSQVEGRNSVQGASGNGETRAGATVRVGRNGRRHGVSVERPEVGVGAVPAGRAEGDGKSPEGSPAVVDGDRRMATSSGQNVEGSQSGVLLEPVKPRVVDGGNGGNGTAATVAATSQAQVAKDLPNTVKSENYIITDADERAIEDGSPREKFRQNVRAIKIARKLEEDGRAATDEEKVELARYVGWGGLKDAFNSQYGRAYEEEQSSGSLTPQRMALVRKTPLGEEGYKLYKEMREVLSEDELKSADASTSSAFFTPIRLCRTIHAALAKAGLKGGRLLETSAGIGNLIGTGNYENPRWTAVEYDKVSGIILKALYPKANVRIQGFEEVTIPNNFYDAAVSNVPFGDSHPFDPNYKKYGFVIHDFFFAKAVDKVHPGGVVAFITSTGTLDKEDKKLIRYLSEHGGKIVGAVRMPNGTFAKNAGTDVATDVIFIQKVEGAADNSEFLKTGVERGCPIAQYFINHPEMCLGEKIPGTDQWGNEKFRYKDNGVTMENIDAAVQKAAAGLSFKSANDMQKPSQIADMADSHGLANGNVGVVDNKLVRRLNDELVELKKEEIPGLTAPLLKKGVTPQKVVRDLELLRTAQRHVIDAQLRNCSDEELKKFQQTLNYEYDKFVGRYGNLHQTLPKKFIDLDYAAGPIMFGMETVEKIASGVDSKGNKKTKTVYGKADIFTKRTIFASPKATSAKDVLDGLRISLNETGAVDTARIAELTGKSVDEVRKELIDSGRVFVNPETSGLETRDEYLSGSVRRKLKAARAAAEIDEAFKRNVDELLKVQPEDISATDISYQLGQNWIPRDVYEQFFKEAVYQNTSPRITLTFDPREHLWHVNNAKGQTEWDEESGLPIDDLLERTMNGRSIVVRKRIDEDTVVIDQEATTATKIVQEKIARAFQSWMTDDIDRANRLERLYNDVMNDNVERKFDTDILEFYGLSKDWAGRVGTKGREYQKKCIARGTFGGNLLIAHCVGAGKTFEMASICMQLRRLGIAKKPMFAVPNHMLAQWNREFHEAYPGAKVLVADKKDLAKNNRRAFLSKVANGDWDCVIVAHSSFSRIAMSPEHQAEYIQSELAELYDLLANAESKKDRERIKKKIQSLQDKLKALLDPTKKDDAIKFEETGCDYLFVDEAHNFKGLQINTHMSNVPGVTGSVSQRAQDLEMKCRYIAKLHGGDKGIVFATGTPISNSVSEMYVMMRYLSPTKMDDMGVRNFDDWAKQFGQVVNEWSPNPSGVGFREKARFSQFQNVPEMKQFFRSFSDIVLDGDLNIKRPKPKDIKHVLKPSDATKSYVKYLNERMETMQGSKVDPRVDNMLKVTTEGRLLAIDPMLIGVNDGTHTRANACADEVKRVYDQSTGKWVKNREGEDVQINGTQLIFCDSGVPKKKQFKELVRDARGNYVLTSGYWTFTVTAPDAYGARQAYGQRVDGKTVSVPSVSDHSLGGEEDLASVYTALEGLAAKAGEVNAASKLSRGTKKATKTEGTPVDINGWLDMNSDRIGYDPRFSNPYAQMEEAPAEGEESDDDKDTSEEANGDVEVDNMLRGKFNMYAELKKQLVRRGIPAEEIAFIHDAETMTQKQALFDKVKKGKVRVLIGNTAKMGEGTNVQDMLVAIHHLDIPWKPAWITQRDGRGVRSGNMNEDIEIHKYITEGTFDVYSWDTVGRKAKFIENAMNARMDQRVIEDADSTVMSLEEGKAAAAGDPRILERVKLIKSVEKKRMEFDSQVKAFDRAKMKFRVAERELSEAEKNVGAYRDAIAKYNEAKGDKPFTLTTLGDDARELTDNTEIAREIQDRLGFFARKGSDVGIVGRVFGFDIRYERTSGGSNFISIKELGIKDFAVTVLPGQGAAFPPSDLSKLKTQITNHTSERALQGFDDYLAGYRNRLSVAQKGVENAQKFDRDAASDELGAMNLQLALLNKALGINDETVHGLARAYAESKGLAKEIEELKDGEDKKRETGANFASPEFDPRKYGIIKDIRTKADVDAINQIVKDAADGKIRIKPYSREEISAGTRFGGPSLGACLLVSRGNAGVWEKDLAWNNGKSEGQGKQIEALLRLSGTYVDDVDAFVYERSAGNVVELGRGGSSYRVLSDGVKVWKIRPLQFVDEDFGGAVHDFNDILLSNAVLGERFAAQLVGGCRYEGQLSMILEQPYVEVPRVREMKQLIFDFMAKNGFEQEEYNEDCFSNGRINLRDVVVRNVGIKDGKLFIFDPQASYTKEYLESQGVLFSTPELDPKRIGITKSDFEAQARRLGRVPFRPKPKTWPEVYQRAEALLNQSGFIERLVDDVAKYGYAFTAEQTIAVGKYQLELGRQYEELRELRHDTENEIAGATDATYIASLNESLKNIKVEESKISQRYATCYKAMRMSKADQGRRLAANKAQFDGDFNFLGMKEARQEALGRDLTPMELKQLHEICDKARDLDEAAQEEFWSAVKTQAEKTIKDLLFNDGVKRVGSPRKNSLVDYRKKYINAMNHLKIYRDTVGGSLIGITGDEYGTWNKPIFDLLLYHRFVNPDITASEALTAVTEDVNTYVEADEQTVARILTGFERSWDVNRHDDVLRGGRDIRSQILTQLQIGKLLNKEMPGKTGPVSADPSQSLRELRHTRDVLKNELEDETGDPRKLQSRQKRWMKWYDNRIEDLKKEIAAGERLPHTKRTLAWTGEMKQKRAEYEELVAERDRVLGPKMSEEERVKRYEASLERSLRKATERLLRAQNDDFRTPERGERPTNEYIESLKRAIEETHREWRQEKKDRLAYGRTAAELKKFNDARERTRTKRVQYWQSLTAPNADRSVKKKPSVPMPPEQQARYDELGRQMKKLRRQVLDMRAHDELMKKPAWLRNGIEYLNFINTVTRSFLATGDHSAVFRQMAQLSLGHPALAAKVFKDTIGTMFSDAKAIAINNELLSDPRIKEAVDKGWLKWRNLEAEGGSNDVEMFSTLHSSAITIGHNADGTEKRLALDDIKVVGSILRGSERIYASYINALSAEIYLALTNADTFTAKLLFGQNGLTDFTKKEIAARINMANGSAQFKNKDALNGKIWKIFWAPKLAFSRAQLAVGWDVLHPFFQDSNEADAKTRLRTSAFNAIEHARAKLAMIALGTLMLMLAGDEDDKEKWRRASLFGKFLQSIKPRIGNSIPDYSGGEVGWYQLLAKWFTLAKESGTGRTIYLGERSGHQRSFGALDAMGETWRFAQGKLNPLLSNFASLLQGHDYVGNPFGVKEYLSNTFIPLGASDITTAFVENGIGRGLLLAPQIMLGAGGNTHAVDRYKYAVNKFTEAVKEYDSIRADGELDADEKSSLIDELERNVPELQNRARIEVGIKTVRNFDNQIRKLEKMGVNVPPSLVEARDRAKDEALKLIRESRR